MPELISHSLVGWLLARALKIRWPTIDPLMVVLGACVPDWISHFFVIHMPTVNYLSQLHEPLPLLALCLLLATFFRPGHRAAGLYSLLLGVSSHYALDFFQQHSFSACRVFFPFSFRGYGGGGYSIEASLYWIPALVLLCAAVEGYCYWRKRA